MHARSLNYMQKIKTQNIPMGTSGPHNLGNDAAADWLFEWQEFKTAGFVEGTLDELLQTSRPDPRLCQEALAAAEVVAAKSGHPASEMDKETLQAVQQMDLDADDLDEMKQKAKSVITIVSGDSGLMARWEDTDEIAAWRSSLVNLAQRLA